MKTSMLFFCCVSLLVPSMIECVETTLIDLPLSLNNTIPSYRHIVQTSLQIYQDLLNLEDVRYAIKTNKQYVIDGLLGKLVRLYTYIKHIQHAFNHEATVSKEEIYFLIDLLEHIHLTTEYNDYVPCDINQLANEIRSVLIKALDH